LPGICQLTSATGGLTGVQTIHQNSSHKQAAIFFEFDADQTPVKKPGVCSTRKAKKMLNIQLNPHQDHHLHSTYRPEHSGKQHVVLLWKNVEEAPFLARDRKVVQLLHDELERLWSRDQKGSRPALPPRLQETLNLLMAGRSEKQIATALSLSQH